MLGTFIGRKMWIWAGAGLLSVAAIPAVAGTATRLAQYKHKHHTPAVLTATSARHKSTVKLHTLRSHKIARLHAKHRTHATPLHRRHTTHVKLSHKKHATL
jgi:hypothetical protein